MAQVQYSASTGATPFTSTTAIQTPIAIVNAATDFMIQLKKYRISYNGVTAANTPILVRFYTTNNATAGTSSAGSITQNSGRTFTIVNVTCPIQYTVEPTTKTYYGDEFLLTPNGGTAIYDFPMGDEPDSGISSTIGMEHTPAQAVGTSASVWFTRI